MFAACMNACMGHLKRRIHTLTVTAMLLLAAVAVVLVAAGFGVALLYVWLQQIYGTMPALAIVAGGCAAFAALLVLVAVLRPVRPPRPAPRVDEDGPERAIADSVRIIENAIGGVREGSRETLLVTVLLAVAAGMALGRKL